MKHSYFQLLGWRFGSTPHTEGATLGKSRSILSSVLRALAALLLALSLYIVAGAIAARTSSHEVPGTRASFLAVGDTGKVHRVLAPLLEGQVAVGNGLAAEDTAHPVDALLLLGDMFYMHGLLESELVGRIRQNLVYPYCHFVELQGPRSAEVVSACPGRRTQRPARPIYAVFGNHDRIIPESSVLESEAIPDFISNWALATDFASNLEFDGGLSVILFDSGSYSYDEDKRAALVQALRAAEGPWRVIATHTPMAISESGGPPEHLDHTLAFQQWVRGAIEQAGVRVHLYLSGHHHSMQVLEGGGELGPAVHVVVGTGARYRDIEMPHPSRRYQAEQLGFARVDLVGDEQRGRLVVSLFRSPTIPILQFGSPQLVGRWSVGLAGEFSQEQ